MPDATAYPDIVSKDAWLEAQRTSGRGKEDHA